MHLVGHDGMDLCSKGSVSMGKDAPLLSNPYTMIIASVTAFDPFQKSILFIFKKRVISKSNKDGDNNTATQSKEGHSMCLPWVHTVATTRIFGRRDADPLVSHGDQDHRRSAIK